MHKSAFYIIIFPALIHSISGCTSIYLNNVDPADDVPTKEILKSIRCEMVSFFTINYQRAVAFRQLEKEGRLAEAIDKYPYLAIDRQRYAGIVFNAKAIRSVSLGSSVTTKDSSSIEGSLDYKSWLSAPNLTVTRNFERGQPFRMPQYATIGPSQNRTDTSYQIYDARIDNDPYYFCYKRVPGPPPNSLEERLLDLQNLVSHQLPDLENFQRIYVGGYTLTDWLSQIGREMSANELSVVNNNESILGGQISYSFNLDAKPSIKAGYTLVAQKINPFAPAGELGYQSTGTFTIYINLQFAPLAFGAQNGTALVGPEGQNFPQTP